MFLLHRRRKTSGVSLAEGSKMPLQIVYRLYIYTRCTIKNYRSFETSFIRKKVVLFNHTGRL